MLNNKFAHTAFFPLLLSVLFVNGAQAGSFFKTSEQLDSAAQCESLNNLTIAGYDLEIESASYIARAEEMPASVAEAGAATQSFQPFCNVKGYFEKRIGHNNQPYAIGFGLALPQQWNGRFLFQGGGGLNGLIREPLGALAAGDTAAVFRGFAVVSTDSGHQSSKRFDPTFFQDQQALLNFHSQAVAKTTALAQALVAEFYGKKADHSYFVGCSTGGREAMTMSQRYPLLYDGIIAGAPARQTNYSEIADLWSAKNLRSLVNESRPVPFTDAQQTLIVDALLQQCDAKDGLADGMVFDVEGCDFDPAMIQCQGTEAADSCLAADQVVALQRAFAGPKYPNGDNVYPGFFYDTGISAKAGKAIPGLLQADAGPLGNMRINEPFDLDRELALAAGFPLEEGNATWLNLSTFAGRGSKLMFFHGVSDPWFSAQDTLQYFADMTAANGGVDTVSDWSQLYLVPGMGHCRGGEQALDQFDMLSALVDWVERGTVPTSVKAFGQAFPERTRPLCPHPQVAHYRGDGDPESAAAFECR